MAARLKRTMSLIDATAIGIGAIIGAGIFVILGIVTASTGPAVVISIVLAGAIAALTAFSFSHLSAEIPKEGGVYEFAHKLISHPVGFLTGFLWLLSNIVTGATVALGFAAYFSSFTGIPAILVAFSACITATMINLVSVKRSAEVNNALVGTKLLVLLFFIAIGAIFFNAGRFFQIPPISVSAILSGAALIFFAYGGFARITTVTEEVKDAKRNVPRAILLALGVSTAVYVLVSIAAVGMSDYRISSGSDAYLTAAVSPLNIPYAVLAISLGALAATASVLLMSILGVSRVMYAMSKNGDLPASASELSAEGIPKRSVLIGGLISALLTLTGDLGLVASISSFALLAYYSIANFAAFKIRKTLSSGIISAAGAVSCVVLIAFLSPQSIEVGIVASVAGMAYYYVFGKGAR